MDNGEYHECEIFEGHGQQETAESQYKWNHCRKNPGHQKFLSAKYFKEHNLPRIQDVRRCEVLRSWIDLTVRIRVQYTSTDRPTDDAFSPIRGTAARRWGTGFIDFVSSPMLNKPCPCVECEGKYTKKHWEFEVRTARHVVYNTEEAKETKVDLFLDDAGCEQDGRMKTVCGVSVVRWDPDKDGCRMLCVTCDEDWGQRIESAWRYSDDISTLHLEPSDLDFLPSCYKFHEIALIISHPHGQPKKITVGEWREIFRPRLKYTAPTCSGSSGAPVFNLKYNSHMGSSVGFDLCNIFPQVHCGSYQKEIKGRKSQVNFGFLW